jgi:hypothetical protein
MKFTFEIEMQNNTFFFQVMCVSSHYKNNFVWEDAHNNALCSEYSKSAFKFLQYAQIYWSKPMCYWEEVHYIVHFHYLVRRFLNKSICLVCYPFYSKIFLIETFIQVLSQCSYSFYDHLWLIIIFTIESIC